MFNNPIKPPSHGSRLRVAFTSGFVLVGVMAIVVIVALGNAPPGKAKPEIVSVWPRVLAERTSTLTLETPVALSQGTLAPFLPTAVQIPSIEYITGAGDGKGLDKGNEGVVKSPLKVSLRLPEGNSLPGSDAAADVSLQLLDENSRPALYGGQPAEPFAMLPAFEPGVWSYVGSMPEQPGQYHAHITVVTRDSAPGPTGSHRSGGATFNLTTPLLRAIADSGPPLVSGFVFSLNSNLWIMSTDGKRQSSLTFFTPPDEYASGPAWSPDGDHVAFAFSPKTDRSQVPSTDIWLVNANGNGAHELIQHGENEVLKDPAWSDDGRYLYFTVEASIFNSFGVSQGGTNIDRFDTKSGKRVHWVGNGEMANVGPPGRMLYLKDIYDTSTDPSQPALAGQQLVSVGGHGTHEKVLVDKDTFLSMNYPAVSPDRKWVAFAAISDYKLRGQPEFNPLAWLGFEPEVAEAHGLPWDVYIVPAEGGVPEKLNKQTDDQPHPAWLNNTTLAYMGSYGLFRVEIDSKGQVLNGPTLIQGAAPHGGLTWHSP